MSLNKQQLEVVNQTNFPDNNTQLITPALLREFNTDIIDSIQLTGSYATTGSNAFVGNQTIAGNLSVTGVISASVLYVQTETSSVIYSSGSNQFGDELSDIQTLSGSVKVQGSLTVNGTPVLTSSADVTGFVTTSSFNAYTSSNNQRVSSLETNSASVNISIANINSATQSLFTSVNSLNQFTQSQSQLNGTFATTGSNTFTGNQIIDRASKLYTNGIYWTDPTAGFNNLEIINQIAGNLDLAALNGGVRIVSSSLNITNGTFTASLQEGFTYVGNGSNRTVLVATSSFGTPIPAGTVSSSAQILNYNIFATTGSNAFFGTNSFSGAVSFTGSAPSILSQSFSGSLITNLTDVYTDVERVNQIVTLTSASYAALASGSLTNPNTLYIISGSSAVVTIPAGTVSSSAQITAFGFVSSSVTASSLITGSVNVNVLTFTKGDGSTFDLTVAASGSSPAGTVSSSAQIVELGFLQTSSFNAYTASQSTASFVTTNTNQTISGIKAFTSPMQIVVDSYIQLGSFDTNRIGVISNNRTIQIGTTSPDGANGVNIVAGVVGSNSNTGADIINIRTDSNNAGNNILLQSKKIILSGSTEISGSTDISGSLTASLQEGYVWVGNSSGRSTTVATSSFGGGGSIPAGTISSSAQITDLGFVSSSVTASSLVTASFSGNTLTFTKGDSSTFGVVIPDVSGSTIDTGSFATTGSNNFIGSQTLSDESGNASTIASYSGSLVLVAKTYASSSAALSHLSASAGFVSIIFKSSNTNTGSFTISGSGNICVTPAIPTTGFRRQVGSNNVMLTGNQPEVTGSLTTYTPNISSNYATNVIRFRGPASSSAWAITNNIVSANFNIGNADATSANQAVAGGNISSNVLLASVNYNAYTTPLVAQAVYQANLSVGNATLTAFSSSIAANNNIFVGNTFTVNNRYFGASSTNAAQRLSLQNNVFGGLNTPTLTAEGSNTSTSAPREAHGNTTNGGGLAIGLVLSGDNSNLYSTLIHGSNLTVTGSNAYNTQASAGSTFIGRNNSVNGTAARSGETIFAVGTGVNNGLGRKTGFLIDSGSNTFVEGTLNVSGSTSFNGAVDITGSLLINGFPALSGNTGSFVTTSSFNSYTSSQDTKNATLGALTGSFATTGSNTFTGGQTINSGGGLSLAPNVGGGGSDNFINIKNENQSTMFLQNRVVSSGYQSGSVLQITAGSGSNGYGFSGSAVFQMDALYNGYASGIKVQAINGVESALIGIGDRISFVGKEGSPYTPSNRFTVDATSIELSGSIKVNTGTSGPAGTAVLNGGNPGTVTVSNSLVNAGSLIYLTKQTLAHPNGYVAISSKGSGTFTITSNHNGDSDTVAYLIINAI